jgi:hypothetical protein
LFFTAFENSPPCIPLSLSERGGKGCPAMSYPLSRIERGTRGELRKAMVKNQLWTFSPDFYSYRCFFYCVNPKRTVR